MSECVHSSGRPDSHLYLSLTHTLSLSLSLAHTRSFCLCVSKRERDEGLVSLDSHLCSWMLARIDKQSLMPKNHELFAIKTKWEEHFKKLPKNFQTLKMGS